MTKSMRKKFDLKQLQEAIGGGENKERSSENSDWFNIANSLEVDQSCTLRLIADKDENNSFGAFLKTSRHGFKVGDKFHSLVCNKHQFNESCPICDTSAAFYKEGDTANGKLLYKKDKMVCQVLIVDAPDENLIGQLKYVSLTMMLFKKLVGDMADLECEPWDIENGCDFTVKKSHDGKWNNYSAKFARKERALTDDEKTTVENESIELKTLLPEHANEVDVETTLNIFMESMK